jgi:hypothetical protein
MKAQHKEQVNQFHTFVGVWMGLKDLVLKSIDKDYLLEIKQERVAFLNVAAQMLTHLRNRWRVVDFVDITALMAEYDAPWSVDEVPTLYFNRVEKAMKQLATNINWDRRAMMNKALSLSRMPEVSNLQSGNRKHNLWQPKHGITSKSSCARNAQKPTAKMEYLQEQQDTRQHTM